MNIRKPEYYEFLVTNIDELSPADAKKAREDADDNYQAALQIWRRETGQSSK